MSRDYQVCVLGGGAWGTALALNALRAGHTVRLWARDAEAAEAIAAGANPRYLPGCSFEKGIAATTDLNLAVRGAHCVLAVVPAQVLRSVLADVQPDMPERAPLVLCAKGIERRTGTLLSAVASGLLPGNPVAALSGPSFATDVAQGLPTAVVIAAQRETLAAALAERFSTGTFRCYSTGDLVGVEIGGALKNVIAIAAGVVAGAGLGASAQAALVTRGFVELRRIAARFGAQAETLMGLSGLGDLILSCGSAKSRNFAYGLALGRGDSLSGHPLAEGVETAAIAMKIARQQGIEAPIITSVAQILDRAITVGEAVSALMSRPLRNEAG